MLGETKSQRITSLIKSILNNSTDEIKYDETTQKAHDELRKFMFDNVYFAESTNVEKHKACDIVEYLYGHYMKNMNVLPELTKVAEEYGDDRAVWTLFGMTGRLRVDAFKEIFIPRTVVRLNI